MKKAVLIMAFIFVLLSISQVSAVLIYNSAKSNIIANRIHGDVLDDVILLRVSMYLGVAQGDDLDRILEEDELKDVNNLLKELKKSEPGEDAKKGLNAVNVKLARMIQVNVLSSFNLLKEKEKEPRPTTAKEIHVNVLSIVDGINSPSSKRKVFRIGKAS